MNIVCNTCLGARLYQLNNVQYANPFMWNIIEANSMIYLIKNFNKLNFASFKILPSDYLNRTQKYIQEYAVANQRPPVIFKIVIEHQIELHYLHYRLDANYSTPTIKDIDIYYDKIWEYVVKKYLDRTKRMISLGQSPLFVISTAEDSYSADMQEQLIEVVNTTPYKMAIITPDLPGGVIGNAHIIHSDIKAMNNTMLQARTFNQQIRAIQT